MRRLQKLSVRQKLIVIAMTPAAGVIALLAGAVAVNEAVEKKRSLYDRRTEQLATAAEIIASRSTAALVFDDSATAAENLSSLSALRAGSALVLAGIFLPDGSLFAEYRPGGRRYPSGPVAEAYRCSTDSDSGNDNSGGDGDLLRVCSPVRLDDELIGEVRLIYDMSNDLTQFRHGFRLFLFWTLAAAAAALGFALLVSSRLQRIISEPVLELRAAMRSVSTDKNYAVRAARRGDDELGALVDGFNNMLTQIQTRDTELERYSSRLEDEVKTRTLQLQQSNRQRLVWLENLAHILRHELKSATVGARSSLDLIDRRAADPNLSRYVERARTSIGYMAKLLDSVGAASTLESSFEQDSKQRLDLAQLAERQVEAYRTLYPQARIVFRRRGAEPLPVLASDARLVQLLDKLIANAIDYRQTDSSIVVAVERDASAATSTALLSVSNRGEPLPDDSERLFELFVSLRAGERKQGENFGLGLYIVKLIAESHGGTVSAQNLADGSGVRFTLSLPLADRA